MERINKVALIGLGAIGSYFADRLQDELGDGLRIIAGGERADRLRRDGMVINGEKRYFHIVSPEEKRDAADLVIVSTKMTGFRQALEDIRNQIGSDTIIMTPLNGVESESVAAEYYARENILYSLMRVSSVKDGNKVTFDPAASFVEFGDAVNEEEHLSPNVLLVKDLFDRTDICCKIRPDMLQAIWEKFVCNVSENQVAAVLDIPFGAWGSCEAANRLRVATAAEVIKIAQKKGIVIDDHYAEEHLAHLKRVPAANKPSTLQDILAGRKTEKDMFAGTVIRMGKELGIPTPYNEFLYDALTVQEEKNAGTVEGI